MDNVAGVKLPVFKSAQRDVASGGVARSVSWIRRACAESRWSAAGKVQKDVDGASPGDHSSFFPPNVLHLAG